MAVMATFFMALLTIFFQFVFSFFILGVYGRLKTVLSSGFACIWMDNKF